MRNSQTAKTTNSIVRVRKWENKLITADLNIVCYSKKDEVTIYRKENRLYSSGPVV
jgi:hypothetical protein